jgi:hypothetical protein
MIPEITHNLSSNTHFRFSLLNFRIVSHVYQLYR